MAFEKLIKCLQIEKLPVTDADDRALLFTEGSIFTFSMNTHCHGVFTVSTTPI